MHQLSWVGGKIDFHSLRFLEKKKQKKKTAMVFSGFINPINTTLTTLLQSPSSTSSTMTNGSSLGTPSEKELINSAGPPGLNLWHVLSLRPVISLQWETL